MHSLPKLTPAPCLLPVCLRVQNFSLSPPPLESHLPIFPPGDNIDSEAKIEIKKFEDLDLPSLKPINSESSECQASTAVISDSSKIFDFDSHESHADVLRDKVKSFHSSKINATCAPTTQLFTPMYSDSPVLMNSSMCDMQDLYVNSHTRTKPIIVKVSSLANSSDDLDLKGQLCESSVSHATPISLGTNCSFCDDNVQCTRQPVMSRPSCDLDWSAPVSSICPPNGSSLTPISFGMDSGLCADNAQCTDRPVISKPSCDLDRSASEGSICPSAMNCLPNSLSLDDCNLTCDRAIQCFGNDHPQSSQSDVRLRLIGHIPGKLAAVDWQNSKSSGLPPLRPSFRLLCLMGRSIVKECYEKYSDGSSFGRLLRGLQPNKSRNSELLKSSAEYFSDVFTRHLLSRPKRTSASRLNMLVPPWKKVAEFECVRASCPFETDSLLLHERHLHLGHSILAHRSVPNEPFSQLEQTYIDDGQIIKNLYPVLASSHFTSPPGRVLRNSFEAASHSKRHSCPSSWSPNGKSAANNVTSAKGLYNENRTRGLSAGSSPESSPLLALISTSLPSTILKYSSSESRISLQQPKLQPINSRPRLIQNGNSLTTAVLQQPRHAPTVSQLRLPAGPPFVSFLPMQNVTVTVISEPQRVGPPLQSRNLRDPKRRQFELNSEHESGRSRMLPPPKKTRKKLPATVGNITVETQSFNESTSLVSTGLYPQPIKIRQRSAPISLTNRVSSQCFGSTDDIAMPIVERGCRLPTQKKLQKRRQTVNAAADVSTSQQQARLVSSVSSSTIGTSLLSIQGTSQPLQIAPSVQPFSCSMRPTSMQNLALDLRVPHIPGFQKPQHFANCQYPLPPPQFFIPNSIRPSQAAPDGMQTYIRSNTSLAPCSDSFLQRQPFSVLSNLQIPPTRLSGCDLFPNTIVDPVRFPLMNQPCPTVASASNHIRNSAKTLGPLPPAPSMPPLYPAPFLPQSRCPTQLVINPPNVISQAISALSTNTHLTPDGFPSVSPLSSLDRMNAQLAPTNKINTHCRNLASFPGVLDPLRGLELPLQWEQQIIPNYIPWQPVSSFYSGEGSPATSMVTTVGGHHSTDSIPRQKPPIERPRQYQPISPQFGVQARAHVFPPPPAYSDPLLLSFGSQAGVSDQHKNCKKQVSNQQACVRPPIKCPLCTRFLANREALMHHLALEHVD